MLLYMWNLWNKRYLKCNTEYKFIINKNNYRNCYQNCSFYYYVDNNNNYHCTEDFSCPPEYPNLIQDKNECVFDNILFIVNLINDIFNSQTNKTNEEIGKEEEINRYNKILEKIESIFTSDNYNLSNIDNGEDEIISAKKVLITFTNIENQKSNIDSNMSTIDLGDCETLLRNYYNFTNNQTLYIKKLDIIQDGMKAKKLNMMKKVNYLIKIYQN